MKFILYMFLFMFSFYNISANNLDSEFWFFLNKKQNMISYKIDNNAFKLLLLECVEYDNCKDNLVDRLSVTDVISLISKYAQMDYYLSSMYSEQKKGININYKKIQKIEKTIDNLREELLITILRASKTILYDEKLDNILIEKSIKRLSHYFVYLKRVFLTLTEADYYQKDLDQWIKLQPIHSGFWYFLYKTQFSQIDTDSFLNSGFQFNKKKSIDSLPLANVSRDTKAYYYILRLKELLYPIKSLLNKRYVK